MGMSASQARYLSLTARKSDLEFRGQQINQSRLMLSNQSANLYSSMLSMSVPTPPVETDFMKDVYTFSLGGDSTTLSSYKLSMGKDGYGYDILYSKPATTNQLTASSVSGVQRAISRKASEPTNSQNTISNTGIKVATKYDDSKAEQQSAPEVSRLIEINSNLYTGGTSTDGAAKEKDYIVNTIVSGTVQKDSDGYTLYNMIHGKQASEETSKPSQNSSVSDSVLKKMTYNSSSSSITYAESTTGDNSKTQPLKQVSGEQLAKIFGGSWNSTTQDYTYENSLLSVVLNGFKAVVKNENQSDIKIKENKAQEGESNKISVGTKQGCVSFYINEKDMSFYVVKNKLDKTLNDGESLKDKATVYKYDLGTLLGLTYEEKFIDVKEEQKAGKPVETKTGKKVYSCVTGDGTKATKNYYTLTWNSTNNKLEFQTASTPDSWKINNKNFLEVTDFVDSTFGIKKNEDIIPKDDDTESDKYVYQYFRDSSTGDIWQLCTKTAATNGQISESWRLFKPNKTYTFDGKEAQLLDKKDWPENIAVKFKGETEYDCYYVPDETGTGGSYYMVKSNAFTYNVDNTDSKSTVDGTRYEANNTYKIEGLTARVVSEKDIPSTILDAYSKDDYIVYATYNDKDTDFSNPVKYYIYPKDDDAAEAVCAYAYEKSYTGKNEILQGRANILVDENGRLAKIDILNQGTYALEYGQEKDEDAYNEAYREYEYKLEKYEKEMADIDARTAMIQQQDKKLELQLKSIDTEHSAIQTELEALKKVIDTNIKSSFGTFGG